MTNNTDFKPIYVVGITGASGFIGKHLVRTLKEQKEHPVLVFDGNILDKKHVDDFVSHCDVVVHLAGLNRARDREIMEVNVLGTSYVSLSCRDWKKRLINIVSIKSYFPSESVYALSHRIKLETVAAINNGKSLIIQNVYGPGCKPFYNSFVCTLAYSIANNLEFEDMVEDPSRCLDLIYVDDVVKDITKLINEEYSRLRQGFTSASYTTSKNETLRISDIIEIFKIRDERYPNLIATLDSYVNYDELQKTHR